MLAFELYLKNKDVQINPASLKDESITTRIETCCLQSVRTITDKERRKNISTMVREEIH